MTSLKWLLIAVVVGYGGLLALMYMFQRALLYFPDTARTMPAQAGLTQASEVTFKSDDGETLLAWYAPPRDAKAAYAYAAAQVPAARIVLFGESLGTAVALALAAERPSAGVILDAPFTSVEDVAASTYWFAPVRLLMKDTWHSDRRIERINAPLLVLHGELDRLVPIRFAEALFALAKEPKRMVRFAGGGHVNLDGFGAPKAIKEFLAGLP